MGYNELLEEAGSFGAYQKLLTIFYFMPTMVMVTYGFWTQVFILIIPPHRCKIQPNETWYSPETSNLPFVSENDGIQRCGYEFADFSVKWNNSDDLFTSGTVNSYQRNIACPYGYVYDFSELFPTITTEHNFVCENAWKMYTVHTVYWIGSIFGFLFFGFISDKFGRKKAYQIAVFLTIVSYVATIFAPTHALILVARFLASFSEGNLATLALILTMEYTGPKYRKINVGAWSFAFVATSAAVPWIAYAVRSWKYILAVGCIPPALCLLFSNFVPESASWLLTRGRVDEAASLVHRVAKLNRKNLNMEHIKYELIKEQSETVKKTELSAHSGNKKKLVSSEKKLVTKKSNFLESAFDLFRTPNMRKRTILHCLIWMIAQMCYTGNSIELSYLPFNIYFSYFIGAISELPASFFSLYFLDKIGRRWVNIVYLVTGGFLGIIGGIVTKEPIVVLGVTMAMRMCYMGSYDVSVTFSSESFPTVQRGRGAAIVRTCGGIASAIAPFIVSVAEKDPLLPMALFGVIAIFGGILNLFVPETANQQLPHTLEEGEDFGKHQSFCFCPFSETNYEVEISTVSDSNTKVPTFKNIEHGTGEKF